MGERPVIKRLKFRLQCWWFGHHSAAPYGYPDECIHCDTVIHPQDTEGFRNQLLNWRFYHWPRWLTRSWYQRCPECGRRFGRHDDNKEHIPF